MPRVPSTRRVVLPAAPMLGLAGTENRRAEINVSAS